MKELDARGLQCPQPLMMAKRELDASGDELAIVVTNEAAVTNLSHLAKRAKRDLTVEEKQGEWRLIFSAASETQEAPDQELEASSYAVFVGKDHVGEGDSALGYSLIKMALYTLSESGNPPAQLLFMNSGVKLVTGDEQHIIDSVSSLMAQGTQVLVCGTCLDFYQVTEQLKVGEVSNMYDILSAMQTADKVITL